MLIKGVKVKVSYLIWPDEMLDGLETKIQEDLLLHCDVVADEIRNAYNAIHIKRFLTAMAVMQETRDTQVINATKLEGASVSMSYVMQFVLKTIQIEILNGTFINAATFLPNKTYRALMFGHCKSVTSAGGTGFFLELPAKCASDKFEKCLEYEMNRVEIERLIKGKMIFY